MESRDSRESRGYFLWADFFRGRKGNRNDHLCEALKENVLFSTLSGSELKYLSQLVYERFYEKNEPVFRQGDRGFGLYVVLKGQIAIRSRVGRGEVQVALLEAGSFFGELSLIEEDNIRSATAVPLAPTALVGFFKADLMEILQRRPQMGVKILLQLSMVLGKRLMETTGRIPEGRSDEEAA